MNSRGMPLSKRIFDLSFALLLLPFLILIMLVLAFLIRITSKGPAIHWSDRVGFSNNIFRMAKLRTMRIDTPHVATHLLVNPEQYVTWVGKYLRKLSLDEVPQIYNILKGDISFVGPRPALFNQDDLVALRTSKGIHRIAPGLTGWAQVNGRDELAIPDKVALDEYYLRHRSFFLDLRIIILTVLNSVRGKGVSH